MTEEEKEIVEEPEIEAKDITEEVAIEEKKEDEEVEEEKGDHPAITLLDLAIDQAVEYCKKNNLPEPNKGIYEGFSRPFLNKAFWHYLPGGDLPDDPRLMLILGVAGLGFACLPTVMAFWRKEKSKEKKEEKTEEKKEEKAGEKPKAENSILLEKVAQRMAAAL